jgi:enoyl-CoA hydratase
VGEFDADYAFVFSGLPGQEIERFSKESRLFGGRGGVGRRFGRDKRLHGGRSNLTVRFIHPADDERFLLDGMFGQRESIVKPTFRSMSLLNTSMPAPGVLLIVLNRPEKRNALSTGLVVELARELERAREDTAVRAVVMTGDDRSFSAGADIREMVEGGLTALADDERLRRWDAIQAFPKPLIAAVNGVCFGGGNELAMLADIMIAGETARFGQPEINIGILPGDGATQRLVRAVGKSLAMKIILSGEPIDAQAALDAGLVAEVVPPERTVERAIELAAGIASKAPNGARLAKAAVLAAFEMPLEGGLAFERKMLYRAFQTADRVEGMTAFLEKRPARFTGQ